MASARRPQPKRLGSKLREIRISLGWTQEQMAQQLRTAPSAPRPADISRFEKGMREPSLLVLLIYARLARVCVDYLIDDRLSLPAKASEAVRHRKGY